MTSFADEDDELPLYGVHSSADDAKQPLKGMKSKTKRASKPREYKMRIEMDDEELPLRGPGAQCPKHGRKGCQVAAAKGESDFFTFLSPADGEADERGASEGSPAERVNSPRSAKPKPDRKAKPGVKGKGDTLCQSVPPDSGMLQAEEGTALGAVQSSGAVGLGETFAFSDLSFDAAFILALGQIWSHRRAITIVTLSTVIFGTTIGFQPSRKDSDVAISLVEEEQPRKCRHGERKCHQANGASVSLAVVSQWPPPPPSPPVESPRSCPPPARPPPLWPSPVPHFPPSASPLPPPSPPPPFPSPPPPVPTVSLVELLNERFSRDVIEYESLEAGILFHQLDGYEDEARKWAPCAQESRSANCQLQRTRERSQRMSASMVYAALEGNDNRIPTFSLDGGVILNPSKTRVFCGCVPPHAIRTSYPNVTSFAPKATDDATQERQSVSRMHAHHAHCAAHSVCAQMVLTAASTITSHASVELLEAMVVVCQAAVIRQIGAARPIHTMRGSG